RRRRPRDGERAGGDHVAAGGGGQRRPTPAGHALSGTRTADLPRAVGAGTQLLADSRAVPPWGALPRRPRRRTDVRARRRLTAPPRRHPPGPRDTRLAPATPARPPRHPPGLRDNDHVNQALGGLARGGHLARPPNAWLT